MKIALVTGGSRGIGKATAIALANEGVQVTLIARNEDKLKSVLTELPQQRQHDYIVADFSNPSELKQKVSDYISKHHGFHILVNNTGGPPPVKFIDTDEKQWQKAVDQLLMLPGARTAAPCPWEPAAT